MQARASAWEPVRQVIMMIVISLMAQYWTKLELLRRGIVQNSKTEHGQTPTFR